MGFTGGARGKEPNTGDIRDAGLILGSGRSPGGGHGNSLHGQSEPGKLQSVGSQRVRHD